MPLRPPRRLAAFALIPLLLAAPGCRKKTPPAPAQAPAPPAAQQRGVPPPMEKPSAEDRAAEARAERDFIAGSQLSRGAVTGGACFAGESLGVLMDGAVAARDDFRPGGQQPALLLHLREGKGAGALALLDLGDDGELFAHNLAAWRRAAGAAGLSAVPKRRAVVISHGHTIAPGPGGRRSGRWSDGFAAAWKTLGPTVLFGPNLQEMAKQGLVNGAWAEAGLTPERTTALGPGLRRLRWSDGSASQRVWLLTYAISPEEQDTPFQPLETVTIVRAGEGYLVHTVCSHLAAKDRVEGRVPHHAVELVGARIAAGELPPGPVHTLSTGTCGLMRTFQLTGGETAERGFDNEAFLRRWRGIKERLGLKRLILVHCAQQVDPGHLISLFQQVFGKDTHLAAFGKKGRDEGFAAPRSGKEPVRKPPEAYLKYGEDGFRAGDAAGGDAAEAAVGPFSRTLLGLPGSCFPL